MLDQGISHDNIIDILQDSIKSAEDLVQELTNKFKSIFTSVLFDNVGNQVEVKTDNEVLITSIRCYDDNKYKTIEGDELSSINEVYDYIKDCINNIILEN